VIAVTGATGFVGGRTAAYLTERGADLRLVVRDPSRAPDLGADVRAASGYGAAEEMRAALEGVDTLFLVPAEESADRVDQHRTAIDAAVAAGVRRLVYLSFVGASPDNTFTLGRHHWATEEHVRASGLPFTFLRMNFYLDFVPMMVTNDVIAGPAGDGRAAWVARDDIAAVAAVVLTSDGHDGRAYDVTGGEALSLHEVAAILSERLGRTITYKDETMEEAWASRASYGAPDWQVEAWISTYTAIAAGQLEQVSDTVERLAGRKPLGLRDVI
jgi:NAD(P)H dehydrogenase (quinone)